MAHKFTQHQGPLRIVPQLNETVEISDGKPITFNLHIRNTARPVGLCIVWNQLNNLAEICNGQSVFRGSVVG